MSEGSCSAGALAARREDGILCAMSGLDPIRIFVCAADDELRAWLADELMLMTWLGPLELESATSAPDELAADLVIVGAERLAAGELDAIANRTWRAPVIAIGSGDAIAADRTLGAGLTSRELKQALRELLVRCR